MKFRELDTELPYMLNEDQCTEDVCIIKKAYNTMHDMGKLSGINGYYTIVATDDVVKYPSKFPNAEVGDILYVDKNIGANSEVLNYVGESETMRPVGICIIPGRLMHDNKSRFLSLKLIPKTLFSTIPLPPHNIVNHHYCLPYIGSLSMGVSTINLNIPMIYNNPEIYLILNSRFISNSTEQYYSNRAFQHKIYVPFTPVKATNINVDPADVKLSTKLLYQLTYNSDAYFLVPKQIYASSCTSTLLPCPIMQNDDNTLNIANLYAMLTYYAYTLDNIKITSPLSVLSGFYDTKQLVLESARYNNNIGIYTTYIDPLKNICDAAYIAWHYGDAYNYKPGDWYLPSAGEWSIIAANWSTIQKKLLTVFGVGVDYLLESDSTNGRYWTSTIFHKNTAWVFNTYESAFVTENIYTSLYIKAIRAI